MTLLNAVDYSRVMPGESVFFEAGADEDFLVVPVSGHINIRVNGSHMAKVGPGVVLGEGAMLYRTPRNASAVAHEDCEIIRLNRRDYEHIAQLDSRFRERLEDFHQKRVRGNALNGSPIFELLDDYRQYTLIDEFVSMGLEQGTEMASTAVDWETGLFVVTAGQVAVILNGDEVRLSF